MNRSVFVKYKTRFSRLVTFAMLFLLAVAIFLVGIFSLYGPAGFFRNPVTASILGLNRQSLLEPYAENEDDLLLLLSPKGAVRLIDSLSKEKDLISDLQAEITGGNILKLSARIRVEGMVSILGESMQALESNFGELPEYIYIQIALSLNYTEKASTLEELRIGTFKIPPVFYAAIGASIDKGLEDFFRNALGLRLKEIAVTEGQLLIRASFID